MEQEYHKGSLRDFFRVLFKHKNKALTVFIAVLLIAAAVTFLLPPTYEATSSLLVKYGREHISHSESGAGDTRPYISLNQEEIVNSEIQILTQRDLFERVIKAIKLEKIYPDLVTNPPLSMTPMDAAIIRFGKKLKVEGVRRSNVIQVSFKHKDPLIAASALNLLVDFFREKHLQVLSDPQSSFLEKQLTAYKQKLQEVESNLDSFKQKNQVFSFDEQRSLLLNQRSEMDGALKTAQTNVDELRQRLSLLRNKMQAISESKALYTNTERDKIIVEAKAKLLSLQLNEQELLRKYTENNRMVINIRKEIVMVANFLKEQEDDISSRVKTANPVYQDVQKELIRTEADLNAQTAKATLLTKQLALINRDIRSLDRQEGEYQNLKREQSINDKNYRTYVDKTEEARISDDMNRQKMTNISVIQAAALPSEPIMPKTALFLALGTIFGIAAGLGYAFFLEHTSQGLSTPENVERRLGLPVLATIPLKKN